MGQPSLLVIVQARLSSSRLPGKVLLELAGRSLLGHLLTRVQRSTFAHRLLVATTTQPADERVAAEARRFGALVVRGSESDVLSRFASALAAHPAQVVVRLTADNPLLDPGELDRVIGEFLARRGGPGEVDYATNHTLDGGRPPLGLDVEVCSAQALERAAREASEPGDREHVMPYLYRVPGRFRVLRTAYPQPERLRHRLTVDTPEDLQLLRALFGALGPDPSIAEVTRYLDGHPELAALNAGVVQRGAESEHALRCRRVAGRWLLGRADASAATGYGHAVRIATLLEAWTELGGRALFVGRGLQGSLAARLSAANVQLEAPEAATTQAELVALLERARAQPAAALAIDGYGFTPDYHRALAERLPLLALDDLAAQPAVADLIVNQNLGFAAARYGALQPGQRVLAGAPYVLLRRGLRQLLGARGSAAPGGERKVVAVALGGSDPLGKSEPLAAALLVALPEVEVSLIVGPGVPAERRQRLRELAARGARLQLVEDPPELGECLLRAELLLCAAGVTAWEALALGVPVVLLKVADNQRVVAEPLLAHGAALDAGWADEGAPARAAELSARLLASPSSREQLVSAGRGLIDGRGVWRVIDALLDLLDRKAATWS